VPSPALPRFGAVDNHARCATVEKWLNPSPNGELRNDSGEILRRLDQGESFVVTRNGVPAGELTPLRRHRFVTATAAVAIFRNAPAIAPGRFRADVDSWAGQDILPHA
jgi:antitoxin (DNA-binding transcriptional repressor) of toxin-antitoxin stability system